MVESTPAEEEIEAVMLESRPIEEEMEAVLVESRPIVVEEEEMVVVVWRDGMNGGGGGVQSTAGRLRHCTSMATVGLG